LLAIDSLGIKIGNNDYSGKQPLFGVAFPFIQPLLQCEVSTGIKESNFYMLTNKKVEAKVRY